MLNCPTLQWILTRSSLVQKNLKRLWLISSFMTAVREMRGYKFCIIEGVLLWVTVMWSYAGHKLSCVKVSASSSNFLLQQWDSPLWVSSGTYCTVFCCCWGFVCCWCFFKKTTRSVSNTWSLYTQTIDGIWNFNCWISNYDIDTEGTLTSFVVSQWCYRIEVHLSQTMFDLCWHFRCGLSSSYWQS